jgi:hypothetical protein
MVPRIIGIAEPDETDGQILELARQHFASIGMAPGILTVETASDDLVAAVKTAQPKPLYGPFDVGADGTLLRKRVITGRFYVEPTARERRIAAKQAAGLWGLR